jgi:hypothetical protein
MVFLTFLARLVQRFLELLNFLGELREVMVYGIAFLTTFLSSAESDISFPSFSNL